MSDDDDDDEFGKDMSESSSEDEEYNKNMKKQAEKLKNRRMQSRQSTIVQVSTGPLEMHLQSMKKQLKEHRLLINHPPFLDELMVEVNKICGLIRKIEHCQLDVNNVRETIVHLPKGVAGEEEGAITAISDRVSHLFKDLEMLRAVLRRVDVHHALDATVLVRVRTLEKDLKALKEFSEKMFSNKMNVVQDEIKGELRSVNARIQQMDELHIGKLSEVFTRIQRTEDNIHEGQKEETQLLSKKVEFLEENLTTDFYSFKKQVDGQLKATKVITMKAFMQGSKRCLGLGVSRINDYFLRTSRDTIRRRFRKWQNFDPVGVLARGRLLISFTSRAHRKMFLRDAMFEWKRIHWLQKTREAMKVYMQRIVHKWKERSFPLMLRRFRTWKRYCVFMNFHITNRMALTNPLSSESPGLKEPKEVYSNPEYDRLIEQLNPSLDIKGSFQLTGLYVDRIYNKISKVYDELKASNETTRRVGHRVEGVRNDVTEMLDRRCGDVEMLQKTHVKQLTATIRDIRGAHEDLATATAKSFTSSSTEINRLESAVCDLTAKVDDQTVRLERLFTLHQKMLDRIDAIEETQKSHESQMATVNSAMATVSKNNARNDSDIMLLKHMTEASMTGMREDITDVKFASNDASKKLQAVLSNQSQEHAAVASLTKDFKSKVSSIEAWLNTTAPKPPSPTLLVSLALQFEDRAVEKHCKDPARMFSVSMSTELAKDIATCAHWLVYHIVEATDVDILTRVMKGPQDVAVVYDQDHPSNALDHQVAAHDHHPPSSQHTSKNNSNTPHGGGHLTHEEFCATTRESMLLRYLEKFQQLLSQSRDDVGVIRREARAMFLKRFIDAVDMSLQKQDAIVLATASSLGRNHSGHASGRLGDNGTAPAACVACDRPLRMRTTTRSIGELYDKLLLSGRKSSELKREVLRNQIVIPHNSPSSALHSYKLEGDGDVDPADTHKTKPTYIDDDNFESRLSGNRNGNNNNNSDQHASTTDDLGRSHSGKGQHVIRVRPSSSSTPRPQSAHREQHPMTSKSAAQLRNTPQQHLASPSKGGGFRGVKSQSQEALAAQLAQQLQTEASILPRHSIDNLPPSTRKLVGHFEREQAVDDGYDSGVCVPSSSSAGLAGSFSRGVAVSRRPNTAEGSRSSRRL